MLVCSFLNLSQNHLDHLPTNIPNQVQALHLGQNRFTALIGFELLQELECLGTCVCFQNKLASR